METYFKKNMLKIHVEQLHVSRGREEVLEENENKIKIVSE